MQNVKHKALSVAIYTIVFVLLVSLFYWLVRIDWQKTEYHFDSVLRGYKTPELTENVILSETMSVPVQYLSAISLDIDCTSPDPESSLSIIVLSNEKLLWNGQMPYSKIIPNERTIINFDSPLPVNGASVTLSISAQGGIALWLGNTRDAGRFIVEAQDNGSLRINDEMITGQLVMRVYGFNQLNILSYYWIVAALLYSLGIGIILWAWKKPESLPNRLIVMIRRYEYLLRQMVSRDFRVKYKASVIGVLWSFLNPMLMTLVYYFVFSSLFKSSMENFVIYLMSGIVLFNFYSEATSQGLLSIVSNAGLINKVYIPKYVFPLSKVLTSAINLVISFIPLFALMAIMGVRFTKALMFIPLLVVFMVIISLGVSMIIGSMYVFFRDMQFLWSLIMTVWMFLTPIFYPETIIPQAYIHIYHANPLYQMCLFARTVILDGCAPSPRNLMLCFISSFTMLLIGYVIFHKSQNRFVLYL